MINAISAYNVNPYAYLGRVASVQPSAPVARSVANNTPEDTSASEGGSTALGPDVVNLSSSLVLSLQAETASNVSQPSSYNSGYSAYSSAQSQSAGSSSGSSDAISGGNSILA